MAENRTQPTNGATPPTTTASDGVQSLIDRLVEDGIEEGERRRSGLVEEAERQAERCLDEAKEEAQRIRTEAKAEADRLQKSAVDAMRLAARDLVLELKEKLADRFSQELEKRLSHTLDDSAVLTELVLEVASQTRNTLRLDEEPELSLLLPQTLTDAAKLETPSSEPERDRLTNLVIGLTGDVLREGVTFGRSDRDDGGLRIRFSARGVELDLTERGLATLLTAHLQPRFRGLLDEAFR